MKTTIVLVKTGDHRVTSTGHAPAGARVYLQDRFDEHDNFATQKVGRASSRGAFRLTTTPDRTDGIYGSAWRARQGRLQRGPVAAGRQARREDHLTEVAPQIVEGETVDVARAG